MRKPDPKEPISMSLALHPPYVLCDLDGVIFDHRHRLHLIKTRPKQWDAYYAASDLDPVIGPVVRVIKGLWRTGYDIVFTTVRPARTERQTLEQLVRVFPLFPKWVIMHRADGDFRSNVDLKLAHLQQARAWFSSDPSLAFDDLQTVIRMYREEGITAMRVSLPVQFPGQTLSR